MMHRMQVDSPEARRRARLLAESMAAESLVRLLCIVSVLRTALTRILPLAGSASWWVTLLCLLPGVLVYFLLAGAMSLTGAPTLTEMLRRCLGAGGCWLGAILLPLLLLADGAASFTALITLFTEGIGTRGTQLTLAVLTGGVLCFCLNREGLPRAVHLLRWLLLAAALMWGASCLGAIRMDGLHPVLGGGQEEIIDAVRAGWSLGWPLALLLTSEKPEGCRPVQSLAAIAGAVLIVLLLVSLTNPHELLTGVHGLPDGLMLPVQYSGNGIRMLGYCLLMLTFFLAIGASAQLAGDFACRGRAVRWPAFGALLLLTASQALHPHRLWALLGQMERWLLLPLVVVALACLLIALGRRMRK